MLVCSASAMTLLTFLPAYAQEARPKEDEQRPDTIVITAQKREETILEVPLTVQAISEDQLENAGVKDIGALAKLIPGASVVSSSSRGFETIQIRAAFTEECHQLSFLQIAAVSAIVPQHVFVYDTAQTIEHYEGGALALTEQCFARATFAPGSTTLVQ
jgi:hypothetical protein